MARRNVTKEKGRYNKTRKALQAFDGLRLDVGYFANLGKPKGSNLTITEYAAVNEFGTKDGRIPERSFMRTTYDKFERFYTQHFRENGYKASIGKLNPIAALKLVGEDYRSDVVNKIIGIRNPPNAESTLKKKRGSNPLIDDAIMNKSIRVRVSRKGIE